MNDQLIKNVHKTFSMYGLTITRNLSSFVAKYLTDYEQHRQDSALTDIIEQILSENLKNPNIDGDILRSAITKYHHSSNSAIQETETIFNVLETREIPKVVYDLQKQRFTVVKNEENFSRQAKLKPLIDKNRYDLLWYRTAQNEIFSMPKFGESNLGKKKLIQVEYLNSETITGKVDVLGQLAQLTEGQYYLEDPTGYVQLDLKKAKFSEGLIVEGTIVVASGYFEDGMLLVSEICLPPLQDKKDSLAAFGNINTFGGTSRTSLRNSKYLMTYERSNSDNAIVFISNFYLDHPQVLKRFESMVQEYNEYPPVAFILCGSFLNSPIDVYSIGKLKEGFRRLAEIVSTCPNILEKSKFVFVPGIQDVGASKILPRPPLPKSVIGHFSQTVPGTILAPNPCRIQYCTKEIVVMRENVLSKLCRNTLHFPKHGKTYEHFARTIISQAHLTPFTISVEPVHWKYDHVLQLYPTPDLIVVADDFQNFTTQIDDCQLINPGSFTNSDFTFMYYIPADNKVEVCSIPKEEED